uniref:Uncharacterized protein n=1 Tax=Anguilla anguilla TaxID=7936 RepID=A0A0E9TLI5_ANGAN
MKRNIPVFYAFSEDIPNKPFKNTSLHGIVKVMIYGMNSDTDLPILSPWTAMDGNG